MNNPPVKIPEIKIPWLSASVYNQLAEVQPGLLEATGLAITNHPTFRYLCDNFITCNEGIRELFARAALIAGEDDPAIIYGETGVGKGLFAEAIAAARSGPFMTLNVTSLPDYLVESELFGHVAGAFTGAVRDKQGLLTAAAKGTVLLDEIGDMPLTLQPKILRAVQQKTVRPVGSNTDTPISCRFLCATHRNLPGMVANGSFRADLYWRLAVHELHIPPLRERPEDIVLILKRLGIIVEYSTLPGNYRELYTRVKRARLAEKLAALYKPANANSTVQ